VWRGPLSSCLPGVRVRVMQCKSKRSERQRRQAGQDKAAHAVGAISRHIWCALLIHGTEEVVVALSCFCSEMKGGRKGAQGKQATNQPGVWLLASLIPRHRLLVPPLNSVEKAPSVHFVPPPRWRHECVWPVRLGCTSGGARAASQPSPFLRSTWQGRGQRRAHRTGAVAGNWQGTMARCEVRCICMATSPASMGPDPGPRSRRDMLLGGRSGRGDDSRSAAAAERAMPCQS
jgi:hypothetical protein